MPKTQRRYDVIVIGAGPAGLMAARQLHSAGLNYIVIDRKQELGYPRKCAGGMRKLLFQQLFGEGRFSFIQRDISLHKFVYRDSTVTRLTPYLKVDRPMFERWLGEGLNIRFSCQAQDISAVSGGVRVITPLGDITGKIAILSYGANFVFQKKLGLLSRLPSLISAYGGIYRGHGLDPSAFHYYLHNLYPGYMWVFPESADIASVGFGNYPNCGRNPTDIIKALNELLCLYNIHGEFIEYYSGIIPGSGPLRRTFDDRLLVAGDAAGQVIAASGEGVCYALKAGRLAGLTAVEAVRRNRFDRAFLGSYEKTWRASFGRRMRNGVRKLRMIQWAFRYNFIGAAMRIMSYWSMKYRDDTDRHL
ncbi:MAG: NAD(P)/FAD-dependent oxidoreductase [Candidatus Omnitrophota bacterium]